MMNKTALAAVAAFTLSTGAAMAETRNLDFAPFSRIDIAAGIHAVVSHGDTQSVRLEAARDGALDQVDISVENGTLRAHRDTNLLDIILHGGLLNMLDFGRDVTVYITVPALEAIQASSGARVESDSAEGELVEVGVSSGATVSLAHVAADKLGLTASSGASMTLSGTCRLLDLSTSSGARIVAPDLSCAEARVAGSSGASAELAVTERLTGSVSSGATIHLGDRPMSVKVETSSGGNLRID